MKLSVYDRQGQVVEEMDFDESVFGKYINYELLHSAIVMYEANLRQGTVKTKNVREVTGRSAKPYRQKGTGRARMGKVRRFGSRGGATCFGPRPRDYSLSMPKTAKKLAFKSAMLGKLRDNEVLLLDQLSVSQPKTSEIAVLLKNLQVIGSCLFVIGNRSEDLWKSVRNIPKVGLSTFSELNAYSVLKRKQLVITKEAFTAMIAEAGNEA